MKAAIAFVVGFVLLGGIAYLARCAENDQKAWLAGVGVGVIGGLLAAARFNKRLADGIFGPEKSEAEKQRDRFIED